jgi:hypothetical protein
MGTVLYQFPPACVITIQCSLVKRSIFLIGFILLIAGAGRAQQSYWQQELHYRLQAKLNDSSNSIDGYLQLQYINHSPDTLTYIWFHLWPNAYKNDRTAFSEQLLKNGRTDFYFSNRESRGYINRLDFRTATRQLKTEDHPLYIDVIKVWLNQPLLPGDSTNISTPFHVQLPAVFSRSGHDKFLYQVTQWYPKPAVYDRNGWHPMPYLDQGEFYSEFASFDVHITLPDDYIVAATGELQDPNQWAQMLKLSRRQTMSKPKPVKRGAYAPKQKEPDKELTSPYLSLEKPSMAPLITLHYLQDSVHDFAWFAARDFIIDEDSIKIEDEGKLVKIRTFYRPADLPSWKQAIDFAKRAIQFRSDVLAPYPFAIFSVVAGAKGKFSGGMEYPGITVLNNIHDSRSLDETIEHEAGHNWFYAALASNERDHPWMDEGMNTFYDLLYTEQFYAKKDSSVRTSSSKLPSSDGALMLSMAENNQQPKAIDLPADWYSSFDYNAIVYYKTAFWLKNLEPVIGKEALLDCMRRYYQTWQFKHPRPDDFKEVLRSYLGNQTDSLCQPLSQAVYLNPDASHKKLKPSFAFNLGLSDSVSYINFLPLPGWNQYDGLMAGLLVHNYTIPSNKFQFAILPLYALGSRQLNAAGHLEYNLFTGGRFSKLTGGLGFAQFSSLSGKDSSGTAIYGGFRKISPYLRFTFREPEGSSKERWLEWKTYLIREQGFDYVTSSADSQVYPAKGAGQFRYLNQLSWQVNDYRVLYPYDWNLQWQQAADFYRLSLTGHYFFNYPGGGGAGLRFFACKFGYIGGKTSAKEFETWRYQPKLTAVRGDEDYTYSNYFMGRNEINGLESQQIMMRDGGLKLRTDLFQGLQGRSDNWVSSINLTTSLPKAVFPTKIPLYIFLDVGTYAGAWDKNSESGRFLYVGGLQLNLFKDLVKIYAPVFYSSEFRNSLKTVPEENGFWRKVSFSIDVQRLNLRRIFNGQIPF